MIAHHVPAAENRPAIVIADPVAANPVDQKCEQLRNHHTVRSPVEDLPVCGHDDVGGADRTEDGLVRLQRFDVVAAHHTIIFARRDEGAVDEVAGHADRLFVPNQNDGPLRMVAPVFLNDL
jgi:hypothetical protein